MESKKILIITTMMVVIMLSLSTIVEAVNIGEKISIYGKLGDVNRDSKINQKDAQMITEYTVGKRYLTLLQKKRADINQDGSINSEDALKLQKYLSDSSENIINVSSVEIDGASNRELEVGKTIQLTATVRPDNAADKIVTWSSTKTSVATVDNSGKVTANSEGTAKIKAKSGTKTDEVTITVKKPANKKLSDYPAVTVTKTSSKPNTLTLNNNKMWIIKPKMSIDYENVNTNKNSDYKCYGAVALYYANRFLGYNVSTSAITTEYVYKNNNTTTNFPGGGYIYNGTCGSYNNQINIIYKELLKGYPVPIAVRNSDGKGIYVLAYAVKESSATDGKILAKDIGVVDTVTGARTNLGNYYQLKVANEEIFKLATKDPNYNPIKQIEGMNLYNSNGTVNQTRINELSNSLTRMFNNNSGAFMNTTKFQKKYCTWWAYVRASQYLGKAYPALYASGNNGREWYNNNKKLGYFNYGTTPKPNSIVVWPNAGSAQYRSAGHVGYVEAVDTVNKKMYVSHNGPSTGFCGVVKMNYNHSIGGKGPTGFIYLDEPLKNF